MLKFDNHYQILSIFKNFNFKSFNFIFQNDNFKKLFQIINFEFVWW